MKIQFNKRSGRSFPKFAFRTSVLLMLFMSVVNLGYLMAQKLLVSTSDLLRDVVGGSDYLYRTDAFIALRTSMIIPAFGIVILVFIGLSLGHYATFGPKDMSGRGVEDEIPWWNLFERILHGLIAIAFVVLLVSGLLITFGRYFGGGSPTLFLRQIHEYAGFVFVPALVITALMWIREALPRAYDMKWLVHFGGYLGYKGHLPSGKFNAGQKVWYWIMFIAGVLLVLSGLGLFYQYGDMSDLRLYVVIHFYASIPVILMFLVHLYMTTLGTKGTLQGMFNGKMSKSALSAYHSESRELKS